jgi:hypothetical protein
MNDDICRNRELAWLRVRTASLMKSAVCRKVHLHKEYNSVCPLVGIGTLPTPLSPVSVPLPPETKGGGGTHTCLRVRGWGSPNSDWRKGLVLCLLCGAVCPKEFFERKRKKETGKVQYIFIFFLSFKYLHVTST